MEVDMTTLVIEMDDAERQRFLLWLVSSRPGQMRHALREFRSQARQNARA